MKIKKNVELPDFRRLGEVAKTILDFAESDDGTMKFECDDEKEAKSVYSTASNVVHRQKTLGLSVKKYGNDVYIVKEEI